MIRQPLLVSLNEKGHYCRVTEYHQQQTFPMNHLNKIFYMMKWRSKYHYSFGRCFSEMASCCSLPDVKPSNMDLYIELKYYGVYLKGRTLKRLPKINVRDNCVILGIHIINILRSWFHFKRLTLILAFTDWMLQEFFLWHDHSFK